ncbi:hypothetical protein [Deinococcus marmoris]|uniref:hypothetical protein n=1 Tax=Deinococcus marmoris TaxID=249408 RepID=UPI0020CA19F4|nr:hypothetical protein [Deinococcus marmoris]
MSVNAKPWSLTRVKYGTGRRRSSVRFISPAENSGWPCMVVTLRVSPRTRVAMRAVASVQ